MSEKLQFITMGTTTYDAPRVLKRLGSVIVDVITAANNKTILQAEEDFRIEPITKWYEQHPYFAFYFAIPYILVMIVGTHLMKDRKSFDLRTPLTLWNFGLSAFSIIAAMRIIPDLVNALFSETGGGFYRAVCLTDTYENRVYGFWSLVFGYSKIIELGDTVFLILRKRPISFLHWYHHTSVMVFTFVASVDNAAAGRWFSSINLVIHSYMYFYYGLKALRYRIPQRISIAITASQLLQMIIGVMVLWSARSYKKSGIPCKVGDSTIYLGLAIYASYCLLFAQFFYKAYIAKPKKSVKSNGFKKEN